MALAKLKYCAFSLLTLLACNRESFAPLLAEQDSSSVEQESQTLTFQYPEHNTRTAYNSTGTFTWKPGDQIAIWDTQLNNGSGGFQCVTLSASDITGNTARVNYTGGERGAVAIYPYNSEIEYSDDFLSSHDVHLGYVVYSSSDIDISDVVSGSGLGNNGRTYDDAILPMIALNDPSSNTISFHHTGFLYRITCNNVPSGTHQIKVSSTATLAGKLEYDLYINSSGSFKSLQYGGVKYNTATNINYILSANTLTENTSGVVLNLPIPDCEEDGVNSIQNLALKAMDSSNNVLSVYFASDRTSISASQGYRITANLAPNAEKYYEITFGGTVTSGSLGAVNSFSSSNLSYCLSEDSTRYLDQIYNGNNKSLYPCDGYLELNGNGTYQTTFDINEFYEIIPKRVEVDCAVQNDNNTLKIAVGTFGLDPNPPTYSFSSTNTRVTLSRDLTGWTNNLDQVYLTPRGGYGNVKLYAIRVYY